MMTLVVRASNPGVSDNVDEARVTITILDVNDNFPVFEKDSYRAKVAENSSPGFIKRR